MNENLIISLFAVAIVAITLTVFIVLVVLTIYFTEKKINAEWQLKTKSGKVTAESGLKIEADENQKNW